MYNSNGVPALSLDFLRRWKREGKLLCVYCAGLHGRVWSEILEWLKLKPDLMLDNDPAKWDTIQAGGLRCVSPEELSEREDCLTFLCSGPTAYAAVRETAIQQNMRNLADINELMDDLIQNHAEIYAALIAFHALQTTAGIFTYFPMGGDFGAFTPASLGRGERIAVYTGVFEAYDRFAAPCCFPESVDYYYISDQRPELPRRVEWIDGNQAVPAELRSPVKRNRYVKMHSLELFPHHRYACYMDGNIKVRGDVTSYLCQSRTGLSAFAHPRVDCIFYEALCVTNAGRVDPEDVRRQMLRFRREGMGIHFGMAEMGLILRDHNNELGNRVMETWWDEFNRGAQRDQLSFSYALWKNALTMQDVGCLGRSIHSCNDFELFSHVQESKYVRNTE